MSLTLASVKTAFQAYMQRTDTDTFVEAMIKAAQDNIISEDYFSWTIDQNSRTITTSDGTATYNLSTLQPTWNVRKIKHIYMKRGDEGSVYSGKLRMLDLDTVRSWYPDPVTDLGTDIPERYYIVDDGKTFGTIPVPNNDYILNIDFYSYAPDPSGNNLLLPEEFQFALLALLANLWYSANDNLKMASFKISEYRQWLKPLLSKDDLDQTKDSGRRMKLFGTRLPREDRINRHYNSDDYLNAAP